MPTTPLTFDWSSPVTHDDMTYPTDTLNRKQYAEFLHNYLANNASNGGYVLNVNAKWGAGKTYFINRWIESIKNHHPVVYVDAWKQDYSDDPMLTVISSILDAFSEHLPPENETISRIGARVSRFFKAAAPILTKGVIKKFSGLDVDHLAERIDEDGADEEEQGQDVYAEVGAKLADCLIKEHNEKLASVQFLRNEMKLLVEAVRGSQELDFPAFIFIDELDRCRPTYAVEMLETIKHFFELDNVVFVIATDTEQLQHAVKAVYGEGFDAQTYLGRFFRRRYSLNELSRYQFIEQIVQAKVTVDERWMSHIPNIGTPEYFCSAISIVVNHFDLSLRDTEQLIDKFVAVLNNTNITMNSYLLLILFVLRDKYYDAYERWIECVSEFQSIFGVGDEIKDNIYNFYVSSDGERSSSFPIKGSDFYGVTISYNLNDILSDMNKYSLPCEARERMNRQEEVDLVLRDGRSAEERLRARQKGLYLGLSAKKSDYRNWVELAVSFGD
ncbi:KAP family P-loop NTPase fold protein [Vibrio harveyi]|uniref:KAP family P-loop NTPase fold protein n=1 Tax=Vibrio harveyi TaxID=669 RepID=UPI0025AFC167|nr:KAP family NTPase [Vibrio harveyi]WJT07818.1 KAP family NTPase [Vibrio harveyi]